MKSLLALFIFCFLSVDCFAQKEDRNWVFGDSSGIDFNNLSNPQAFSVEVKNYETNASVSDPLGNIQCYVSSNSFTDNYLATIINDQNQAMEDGDSILLYNSATNGCLFIPMPNDSQKIYFFHTGFSLLTQTYTLHYSLIDLGFNAGHGKVTSKNIVIADSTTEHLLALRHGNGRDWWLITKKINANVFIKYLVSSSGISGPFYQTIGSISYRAEGECSVSKVGDKVGFISSFGNMDVFNFNRCTGDFSNWIELGNSPYNVPQADGWFYYGCEFSPNANRFYVSRQKQSFPYHTTILQYTLNFNPISSKTNVLSDSTGFLLGQMELAPDDKIYIAGFAIAGALDSSYKYLTVINSPDDSTTNCDLVKFSFYLQGQLIFGGLPNMPHYNLSALDGSACDTLGIDASNNIEGIQKPLLNIYPNPANDELTIEILNGIATKEIEIKNAIGVTVLKFKQTKPNQQINIKSLAAGVYFIKITFADGETEIKKMVKE